MEPPSVPSRGIISYSVPKKVRRSALQVGLTVRNTRLEHEGSRQTRTGRYQYEEILRHRYDAGTYETLFIIDRKDETVEKSARNIPYVKVLRVEGLNVYDVIRHEQLIMTVDALKKVEEVLAS